MMWTALLGLAWAARITVDPSGGDFADLPDALAAAQPGDYLVVYPGSYSAITPTGTLPPILGIAGSADTWIDDTSAAWSIDVQTLGTLRLEGFTLTGAADGGVYHVAGLTVLRDVQVLQVPIGLNLNPVGSLSAESLTIAGTGQGIVASLILTSPYVEVDGLTLVDNTTHLYGGLRNTFTRFLAIGGALDNCALSASHGIVSDYGTLPACVTLQDVLLDVDPGFLDYSDDGDATNDDLRLAPGSPAIDADGSCLDADGSACDLGATGGSGGGRVDSDGDGLPDQTERAWGLDPALDDGQLDDDGDGLDNLGEYLFDTDPFDPDSDGDGEEDLSELEGGRDPNDPRDNAPTAVAHVVGDAHNPPLLLDGSDSSDPTGDALTYTWTLVSAPAGSALGPALGEGAVQSFTPDVAGFYTIRLTVSDGFGSDDDSATVFLPSADGIRIPEDFASFAEALPYVEDGMTVRFGAGSFEIDGPIELNLALRGAGRDRTVLTGTGTVLEVSARSLSVSELSVTAQGSASALVAADHSLVQLRDVALSASGADAVGIRDSALLGWGLRISSISANALQTSNAYTVLAGSQLSTATGYAVEANRGKLYLSGVLVDAQQDGLWLGHTTTTLDHVTIHAQRNGILTFTAEHLLGQDVVIDDALQGVLCMDVEPLPLDHLLFSDVTVPVFRCGQPIHTTEETDGIGAGGLPRADSAAWDGGNSWRLDPDGTRSDLGFTGGPFGLGYPLNLADPDADADGDGLLASSELLVGSLDDGLDSDRDGVADTAEIFLQTNPGEAADHHPSLDPDLAVRLNPGDAFTLELPYTTDPDGEDCVLAWDDGAAQPRAADTSAPGVQELLWTLRCGAGVSHGRYTVIVQEPRPVSPADWEEALRTAPPYATLVLEAGAYPVPDALPPHPLALVGVGPETHLIGDLTLEEPHALLRDLVVDGDLRLRGEVVAVRVDGALYAAQSAITSTRVQGGPLDASRESEVRYATAQGDLLVHQGSTFCSAGTGRLRVYLPESTLTLSATEDDFIALDEEPALSVLEPWPGSALWTTCTAEVPQGSDVPYDIGATGGPDAWPTDLDEDGMNDAWERLQAVDDPTLDPDEDGLDNLAEFTAGTDAHNADTDGDRLPDGEDPHPRGSDGDFGIRPSLSVSDHFPYPGDEVILTSTGSVDDAGGTLRTTWLIYDPDGALRFLRQGETVAFPVERRGAWRVRMELQAEDGATASREDILYGRRVVQVPEDLPLREALLDAEPGDALVLHASRIDGDVAITIPVVIAHAEGATRGRLDGGAGGPAVQVRGTIARLEDIAVRADDEGPGLQVINGTLELRRAAVVGGTVGVAASQARVELENSVLIGSRTLLNANASTVRIANGVVGWAAQDGIAIQLTGGSTLRAEATIFSFSANVVPTLLFNSTLSARSCLFTDRVIPNGFPTATPGSRQGAAAFLLDPNDAEYWLAADLRLSPSSDAVDWEALALRDLDGSALDLGVFGGPLGDWIDIDNDRDGFTNLDGDCDDFDPQVVPDPLRGECPATAGCQGCASGSGSAGALAALLALGLTRRHDRRAMRG